MTSKEELKALIVAAWNDNEIDDEPFGVFVDRAAEAIKEAGYVKLANDPRFPAFLSPAGQSEVDLVKETRQAIWKAGWRKVLLEVEE